MNNFKKIFAVAAATATMSVMSFATISADAALTPAEEPPYTVFMSVQGGADSIWEPGADNSVELSGDGSYSTSFTFTVGTGTLEALIFDSNINLYSFAPEETSNVAADTSVRMTIDSIKIVRVGGGEDAIAYNGPAATAFRAGDDGTCMRVNVLNTWTPDPISDIDGANLPGGGVMEGDKLVVDWTITGLGNSGNGGDSTGDTTTTTTSGDGSATTTTTTTKKNSGSSANSNKNNSSSSTTSTVTQTADAGVVAIVVGAAAAASLAVGAMTFSKKRK